MPVLSMSKMSINFNPGPKILALLDQQQWADLSPVWGPSVVTGTGSATAIARRTNTSTGATASSTALRRTADDNLWSLGQHNTIIEWTKRVALHFIIRTASTTNGISRISLGKTTADGIGNLARKGIGIRTDEDAIKGQCHDGSSLATVGLSTTITNAATYRVSITSDGARNLEWFVNGISKGTSSGGPKVLGTAGESVIQLEADNGGDSALQYIQIADAKIYVGLRTRPPISTTQIEDPTTSRAIIRAVARTSSIFTPMPR